MGNDGGSIPSRKELVKEAARQPSASELRATLAESLAHRWTHCFLTDLPLKAPVVSDARGRLFNKAEILEFILSANADDDESRTRRREGEEKLERTINSSKDIVEVHFTDENNGKDWVCPVTQKRLDENTRAVYIVPCGHAFAEAALKETLGAAMTAAESGNAADMDRPQCLQCNTLHASNDIVPLLPTNDLDIARLALRAQRLKDLGLTHSLKKAPGLKKRKRCKDEIKTDEQTEEATRVDKKVARSVGLQNATTASITARVLEEQKLRQKDNSPRLDENLRSLYTSSIQKGAREGRNNDFMTRGFAVPANQKR